MAWSNGAANQLTTTIRATPVRKAAFDAFRAEGAFEGADHGVGSVWRQIFVTTFTVGLELEHLCSSPPWLAVASKVGSPCARGEEQMQFPDLVKAFANAAAAGNGDALADLFTPDGTYDDYFFGPCSGREAIKKMLVHFAEGGRNFRWDMFDPAISGNTGYASYRFSFDSRRPEAKGVRVTFDGIGRFDLKDGLIQRYSEVFDRGMALAQQAFEGERLRKIGLRYAAALKARPEWKSHL
jgi:hypothetical protein